MNLPRILMFGVTGQLARAMSDLTSERGANLVALSRDQVDLADSDAIRDAIFRAESGVVVVNAAAYTSVDQAEAEPELAHAINAVAPEVMAKACFERGNEFIHLSTDYVFGGTSATPYLETDETDPQCVYGRTKRDGERAVLAANPNAIIVRTAWVYSPYGRNFVKTMLRLGSERDDIAVVDDQRGAPTSAHDLADGLLAICSGLVTGRRESGIFHLTGTGEASWAEFAEAIFESQQRFRPRRPKVTGIGTADYPTPAKRPMNSRLVCDRLYAAYGYRAPHWRESLARVIARLER